jgi:leucyl aminopeptidase
MLINQQTSIDQELDLVVPFRKGAVSNIQQYVPSAPDFEANFAEFETHYITNGQRVYLIGLGEEKDASRISDIFHKFAFTTKKHWTTVQLDCQNLSPDEITQAVLGFELASYELGVYKTGDQEKNNEHQVYMVSTDDLSEMLVEGKYTGESINRIKTLVDAPANVKTPNYLADWAVNSASAYGYTCDVLDKQTLEKEGFGAVLAVGKGSEHPPALIVTKHLPKPGNIDIALVGKGITFDTGGLSIKPSQNLHYMKSDMGGAAAVLGAVELAAKLQLNVNVIGVVATAENAVDAKSFRPGDVITSYSGKTIEIIDTDAEGRLVLADALSYVIKNHQPERVIDLATLTGSVVRTLGYTAAGMFTKNHDMQTALSALGETINERVWPLPLFDDYDEDLHSDIADLRNFSNKPVAGGSSAAKFLEAFTESHTQWMHLDIAGVAFGSSDYAKMKSASGYGVRLMIEYLKSINYYETA